MILEWKKAALNDRERIMDFISSDNPQAAFDLDALFKSKAKMLVEDPKLFKQGRLKGTREAVVHRSYMLVYQVKGGVVTVLRVLHTSQSWPK